MAHICPSQESTNGDYILISPLPVGLHSQDLDGHDGVYLIPSRHAAAAPNPAASAPASTTAAPAPPAPAQSQACPAIHTCMHIPIRKGGA